MAQIKCSLSHVILLAFLTLPKKNPAAWQERHSRRFGTIFAASYCFAAGSPDGSLKKRKKSLSGLSNMVEPPDPNACL